MGDTSLSAQRVSQGTHLFLSHTHHVDNAVSQASSHSRSLFNNAVANPSHAMNRHSMETHPGDATPAETLGTAFMGH